MRTLLSGFAGFLGGTVLAWGVAVVWNPPSYEDALPLIYAGALGGAAIGVVLARRRRSRGPGAKP